MVTMPVDEGFVVTSGFGPRWGTHHWGTDFGLDGGSGGKPIYAVKDGTVARVGPASGFGQWIGIDHPATNGGGETIYGHIIPEVTLGQQVSEGQRIGRINPDSRTNGGVAPHLHLEWHRYTWTPPGPDRLDPMTKLAGAKWPGAGKHRIPEVEAKVIYGVDVSEHQDGMSLVQAKREGIDFAILRLCDGTYKDKVFRSHLEDAENAGMLVSTYWYLRAPSEGTTIAQQVDVIDQQMGGRRDLGVWIDVESIGPGEKKLLTKDDVWAAKRELEKRGYHVPGIYSGAWYWEKMPGGEPSMQGLGHLWVSNYGRNRTAPYKDAYIGDGGDNHPGWSYPLGDRKPDILQYGSNGMVAGFTVDVNAFKGTREQLARVFHPGKAGEVTPVAPAERAPLTLDTPCKTHVDGSEHTAPLADFIMYADKNSFLAMKNSEAILALLQRIDGRQAAIERELKELRSDRAK
ncbi:GH25 family lysozyme [Corynebacterium sp. H113]|uniref:GH25 family lysozyme n=1 Tax=Corynebacterium sp. H113 TaxID=3133419 RepID=UPI0030A065CD